MSEDEVERFEITDYDLDNEFNINRPRRKQSKNQQIYGIWADDSGDEGESSGRGGFGTSSRQRGRRKQFDTSAPISFVAGGVQQAGKKGKKDEAKNKDVEMEEEEEEKDDGMKKRYNNSSSDSDDGGSGRTGFGAKSNTTDIDGDIAGLRRKRFQQSSTLISKGVGNWEKHTKGIGAKLLMQMGYQPGKGLGKELQGISAPVEAHLRKGRGAIGAYGPEKVTKMEDLRPELKRDKTDDDDDEKGEAKLTQWRKEGSKSAKVKYVYKSVDEVLEDQDRGKVYKREFNQLSKVKVIDMTGPQQRVLSGYHAISGPQRPADEWETRKEKKFTNFALPELQHNLNLLVDMCEQDIIASSRKLRHAKDKTVTLEQEEQVLTQKIEQEQRQIEVLEKLVNIVNELESKTLDLQECAQAFTDLQANHYEAYRVYDLGDLAPEILKPLFQEEMKDWDPFLQPKSYLSLFGRWKRILEGDNPSVFSNMIAIRDPYHRLVWEIWMPVVRGSINSWNCRDCIPLITLLEEWMPLLPAWILEHILDQQVLPRVTLAVEEWNPLTDTVPIHTWIHPWLPLLGQRLNVTIFPIIRHKLSTALLSWHPSDRSAHLMLLPWSKAFDKGDMDAFLVKNILPKLQLALSELVINPHQQHLDNWNWVMDWSDLMPVHTMASLLDKLFFPKWLQVLTVWLNHSPDYEQVSKWYSGWKSMFSETLLQQPVIKEHFRKALDLMNRAVSNPGQSLLAPAHEPTFKDPTATQQQQRFEAMAEAVKLSSQIPQGFKDLLQKRCEERGIMFVPLVNRWREGKQIYRMGNLQIYIDRSVIFVSAAGGLWQPTSLNAALEMAV